MLFKCIRDPSNYDAIISEIRPIVSKMKYWKVDGMILNTEQIPTGMPKWKYDGYNSEAYKNRAWVCGLMLARRGYVQCSNYLYNDAYLSPRYYDYRNLKWLKESAYEYAETLQFVLNTNGVDVNLVYDKQFDRYCFDNPWTHGRSETLPFNRSLIDTKNPIPPIR